jgi:hypothetical protein
VFFFVKLLYSKSLAKSTKRPFYFASGALKKLRPTILIGALKNDFVGLQGGSEFGAVPAATGRLVSIEADRPGAWFPCQLGPYQAWFSGVQLSPYFERAKVPGTHTESPFCFGFFWGSNSILARVELFSFAQKNTN